MNSINRSSRERGAVSLFIVVFAALLITVVTVGFIRLMIADQQQATANDLSRSAYDSAQAGVEDAKRAVLRYQTICATSTPDECSAAYDVLSSDQCNQGLLNIVDISGTEVKVRQTVGDDVLDQAYTCVKILVETADYVGTLPVNSSKIIPLKSTLPFDTIQIEWYDQNNITNTNFNVSLIPKASASEPLFTQSSWGANRPSLMRAQLMQFGYVKATPSTPTSGGFRLSDFDDTNASSESNANTLFLYPVGASGTALPASTAADQVSFGSDTRKSPTGTPNKVTCSGNIGGGGYACRVRLIVPTQIGGSTKEAYLRLSALYNATNYRVTLLGSSPDIKFDGVQPAIDSTGRANELFRRVVTRIEPIDTTFAYPEAAVDTTGSLCKNFAVTDQASQFVPNTCTP